MPDKHDYEHDCADTDPMEMMQCAALLEGMMAIAHQLAHHVEVVEHIIAHSKAANDKNKPGYDRLVHDIDAGLELIKNVTIQGEGMSAADRESAIKDLQKMFRHDTGAAE